MNQMRISASIFVIALGAVLTFAVQVQAHGFDIHTVGVILMIAGAAALVLTLVLGSRRQRIVTRRGPAGEFLEERRSVPYDDPTRL